ncbi:hypothetical protein GOP47_0000107 [Adiantum capillus-veneris]|uniref:Uncharacterized protein n=1 Tax=Adiantum capillus-veneris TaxID=13818 RepID=A0A9D4VCX5_ADICA|nr:hypothetical protein GOP47_0000107 [Adiantum capillus-veneris]
MVIPIVGKGYINGHYNVKDEEDVTLVSQYVQGTDTMGVKNGGLGPAKVSAKDVEDLASMKRVQDVLADLESGWRKEKVEGQDVYTMGGRQVVDIAMEKREVVEGQDSVGMNTIEFYAIGRRQAT